MHVIIGRRAPLDNPRPNAREDMDMEDSPADSTRRTPGASKTMCRKAVVIGLDISSHHCRLP